MPTPKFGTIKSFYKDEIIFKEGQPGDVAYLVRDGEVAIYKIIDEDKKILDRLGPGEIFGEMGLVTNSPRTAFAQATEFCDLVIIDKETLHKMLRQSPKLVQSITLFLIKRLASTLLLLEKTDPDDISKKNFICICRLLDLVSQYAHKISYHQFCTQAKKITELNLSQVEMIISRLVRLNLVKIDTDKTGRIPRDAKISVLVDREYLLRAAKQMD